MLMQDRWHRATHAAGSALAEWLGVMPADFYGMDCLPGANLGTGQSCQSMPEAELTLRTGFGQLAARQTGSERSVRMETVNDDTETAEVMNCMFHSDFFDHVVSWLGA
jgi:hypothetical protein